MFRTSRCGPGVYLRPHSGGRIENGPRYSKSTNSCEKYMRTIFKVVCHLWRPPGSRDTGAVRERIAKIKPKIKLTLDYLPGLRRQIEDFTKKLCLEVYVPQIRKRSPALAPASSPSNSHAPRASAGVALPTHWDTREHSLTLIVHTSLNVQLTKPGGDGTASIVRASRVRLKPLAHMQ